MSESSPRQETAVHLTDSGDIELTVCGACGVEYKTRQSLIKHLTESCSQAGYTCKNCGRAFPTDRGLRHHLSQVHNEETYTELECEYCGDTNLVQPYRDDMTERHFCDHNCYGEWLSANRSGEEHPMYIDGGEDYYGTKWEKIAKQVRERDNYQCRACGALQDNLDRDLDVHHIIPFREFESAKEAHQQSNLVSLCRSCHQKWEGIPVKPQLID